jgi:ssRNA-specific RNase YbeY (16S rRNA maturation enzyme)
MSLASRLNKTKAIILKTAPSGADFYYGLLDNKAMEELRAELILRPDFKGKEARKITKEKMVNVLSFPQPKGFPNPKFGKNYLGEVYLNQDFGKGDFEILGPLFIHGFLHLLGYRHDGKRDTMEMKKEEKRLWVLISLSASTSAPRPSKRLSRKSRGTA